MKRKFFIVLPISAFLIFALISCTKEPVVPPYHVTKPPTQMPTQVNSLMIICKNWVKEGNGRFTDRETGILSHLAAPSLNHPGGVNVFLKEHQYDLPINTPFKYRLGYIWAEIGKDDLVIQYQADNASDDLPFSSVAIEVRAE